MVAFAELRLVCLGEGPSVLITRLGNRKHRETEKRREEKRKKIERDRDRDTEREKDRKKKSCRTMASEMEVTAVTTTGLAPVVTLKTFLPESAVVTVELDDEDLYTRQKLLQRQLEFVDIQEEYIKDELKNLKREHLRAQEEVKRIQSVPLVIGQFIEMVDQNNGIVGSTTGSNYYVRILSTINRELLKPSSSVALHRHSNALVDVLPPEADSSISLLTQSEKPDVSYNVNFFLSLRIRFVILCLETLHIIYASLLLGQSGMCEV